VKSFQLEGKFLALLHEVDVAASRLMGKKDDGSELDIAVIEGTPLSEEEISELKKIRERSKFLIAFGSCATLAGVNAMRNALPQEKQALLLGAVNYKLYEKAMPLSAHIKVDYEMNGCPIEESELFDVLNALLHGILPKPAEAPVCFECRIQEVNCFLLRGIACMGPVTNCGCWAVCTMFGVPCVGCRGLTKDANLNSLRQILQESKIPEDASNELVNYFNANFAKNEKAAEEKKHA